MNRHGYGNEDTTFEDFRRKRQKQRQRFVGDDPGVPANKEALRQIEEREQREARELRLRNEIFDFIRDTIKLAAGVLSEVSGDQAEELSQQITSEMHDFFKRALFGTEDLLAVLKAKYGPEVLRLGPQELEAHMAQLSVEDMDRYRAEGSAEGARLHLGQRPAEETIPEDRGRRDVAEDEGPLLSPVELDATEAPGSTEVAESTSQESHEAAPVAATDRAEGTEEGAESEAVAGTLAVDEEWVCATPSSVSQETTLSDPVELDSLDPVRSSSEEPEQSDQGSEQGKEQESEQGSEGIATLLGGAATNKKALTALVKAGVLTRREARDIYRNATGKRPVGARS